MGSALMARKVTRWVGRLGITVGVVAVVLLVSGFFWFVAHIPPREIQIDRDADGIVVLTGAASRIPDGIELLAAGRGKRLLITGVHRATRAREIARLTPLYSNYFTCCIDLDRSALNTFGNAIEAKRWAYEHGFKSLIVVTSNWHIQRAMVELGYQLPDITLIPYPVVSDRMNPDTWWSSGDNARLIVAEYLKYLLALARLHLDLDTA
jgi:uncharacterized SAM-binding protein YcdF (DUF218 family)